MIQGNRKKTAEAGNKGEKVRSDCYICLETGTGKGLQIELRSKVERMFGRHIKQLVTDQLASYGIHDAKITIEDTGALDFVIMARVEAAVTQLTGISSVFLPEMIPENQYPAGRERIRLSRLYLPGNNPSLMLNAGIHKPDGIILDLEDSVPPDKKAEARLLVRNALRAVDFFYAERMVRINPLPGGAEDLKEILPHNVHMILIPKAENEEQIREIDRIVDDISGKDNKDQPVFYMPILESALGIENAFNIATASPRIVAMAIGLEDLTADMGVQRTGENTETLWARSRMVNACVAAGIQPIDSVYSDVSNMEGLMKTVKQSKAMGFAGMGCIHPRQIPVIHKGFAPTTEEVIHAAKIRQAFDEARKKGLGVVSLGTRMIDPPVVKRALHTLKMAEKMGIDITSLINKKAGRHEKI